MESLGFSVTNLEETRSRRSYNCYRAGYPSIYSPLLELKPELLIETYIALLPFPTVNRMADNYIYRFLKKIVDKEIYRQDYESITGKLLFTYVPYETVISGVKEIINKGYFSDIWYDLSSLSDKKEKRVSYLSLCYIVGNSFLFVFALLNT